MNEDSVASALAIEVPAQRFNLLNDLPRRQWHRETSYVSVIASLPATGGGQDLSFGEERNQFKCLLTKRQGRASHLQEEPDVPTNWFRQHRQDERELRMRGIEEEIAFPSFGDDTWNAYHGSPPLLHPSIPKRANRRHVFRIPSRNRSWCDGLDPDPIGDRDADRAMMLE